VIELIMRVISAQANQVNKIRRAETSLDHGIIKKSVIEPFLSWREQPKAAHDEPVSKVRFASALTIIADLSVLFGTRDWSVTGTISTMASALAALDSD
jgi:hypothetical protein